MNIFLQKEKIKKNRNEEEEKFVIERPLKSTLSTPFEGNKRGFIQTFVLFCPSLYCLFTISFIMRFVIYANDTHTRAHVRSNDIRQH